MEEIMPIPDILAHKIMADFRAEKSMGAEKNFVTFWYSSFRILNINNGQNHVTFVEKCLILCLVVYLLAPNHNRHDDIDILHLCVLKWLNETQQTQINATIKVVQMIRKDVFKYSDRCLLAEAKD